MAILSQISLTPWIDPNGDPYSGAKAYFFDAETTTPRIVYTDADLSIAHDHPVVANGSGRFPAIFLPEGDYRLRITDSDGVVLEDIDGISTPTVNTDSGGGGGDTDPKLLFQTGDYIFSHRTGTKSGWVRANGRTIGNAASGATERANADCEDLFLFLWNQDTTLTVSGGRGATADGDFAANKQIALPDMRLRSLIGMAGMGNTSSTLLAGVTFDNSEDGDDLGATVGEGTVTLTVDQLPAHDHTATTASAGSHSHSYDYDAITGPGNTYGDGSVGRQSTTKTTTASGAHTHDVTVGDTGSDEGHPNVQPSAVATCYIKL